MTTSKETVGSASTKDIRRLSGGRAVGMGYSDVAAQLFSSLDMPVRNPDRLLLRYREMAEFDETVGVGLEFLCYAVIRKIGNYVHTDPKIHNFVLTCIEHMRGTLEEQRRALLSDALAYGFGVAEFTLVPDAGQWRLSSLQQYDPSAIEFKFERASDNALVVSSIVQRVAGKEIIIPASKCYLLRHNAGTNPYGRSRLRRVWRWFAFKRAVLKFWAVALERFGMPMLVGKAENPDDMAEYLESAYSKAFVAIGVQDSVEAVAAGGHGGIEGAYASAMDFCNRMIFRALFLPALLESGQDGGSYALGRVHWRMFDDACLWIARDLAEMEIEELWRPIIEWNFGPQASYGTIPTLNSQTPEEQEQLSKVFMNAVNAGFVRPEEGDATWLRDRLGFPEVGSRSSVGRIGDMGGTTATGTAAAAAAGNTAPPITTAGDKTTEKVGVKTNA